MKEYPRVLIVSHNALSKTNNNGKTIETFFDKWPKENISHLYFSPEEEDLDFCNNSFVVHDYDMLDNFLRIFKRDHYNVVKDINAFDPLKKNYSSLVKKIFIQNRTNIKRKVVIETLHNSAVERKPFILMIREIIWLNKKWFQKSLYNWIEEFNPEILFFQGSGSYFSYNLVDTILEKYNLPIVLECTDDYTQPLYPNSIIDKFLTNKYLKIFQKTIKKSRAVYAISDKMSSEYLEKYGGNNYYTVSNSVNRNIPSKSIDITHKIVYLYAGNLGLNRWHQLCMLGEVLDILSVKHKLNLELCIYSSSILTDEIKNKFAKIKAIKFKGFVNSNELNLVVSNADFLVHVESFDKTNMRITRLSISTKLGEYIASNRCILAIGPDNVASIEYIKEKQLGQTISTTDRQEIKESIEEVLFNQEKYEFYIKNAFTEYRNKLTQERIDELVYNSIKESLK